MLEKVKEGQLYQLEGGWDTGFRVGGGVVLPFPHWESYLQWARFDNSDEKIVQSRPGLLLFTTRGLSDGPENILSANSSMSVRIDMVQWALALSLPTRIGFLFKPHVALRYDSIKQDFDIFYLGTGGATNPNEQITIREREWGLGPEVGLQVNWSFCHYFFLFGEGGLGILWGDIDYHTRHDVLQVSPVEDVNVRYQIHNLLYALNLQAGVRGQLVFRNCFKASIQLGWECHSWLGFNPDIRFVDSSRDGTIVFDRATLGTSGATLRWQLEF